MGYSLLFIGLALVGGGIFLASATWNDILQCSVSPATCPYASSSAGVGSALNKILVGAIMLSIGFIIVPVGAVFVSGGHVSEHLYLSKSSEEESPKVGATPVICPSCNARIPADIKFCSNCGRDLRVKQQS